MTVRPAAPSDLDAIQQISRATGQRGRDSGDDPAYVQLLLATASLLVTEREGLVAGWGAVRPSPLGGLLTDLFVDPRRQGGGVGAELLSALWPDAGAAGRYTFSSQHADALPLYARGGVRPSGLLVYFTGSRSVLPPGPLKAWLVPAAEAAATDAGLVGIERVADYGYWAGAGGAFVVCDGERTVAAGAVAGSELLHLTCPDAASADDALLAALDLLEPDEVSLCLPGEHPSFTRLVQARFRITDHDIVMTTPGLTLPSTWVYSPGLA